ncbi:MAG: carbohydrate-binding family 9-like protein [Monoglobales bacterium]
MENMEYFIAKTNEINPGIYSPEWDKAQTGYIDKNLSGDGLFPSPKTFFKLLEGPEGLSVLMHTEEKNLRSEIKEENGEVCEDSCMEFFFKPTPWDARYLNFEVNPEGVMHIGIGTGRHDRTLITEDRKTFDIVSVPNDGDWTVKYYIPFSFIDKWYPNIEELSLDNSTNIAKGNFYKCGEETDHPHFACWSEVITDIADFHVPDFFGRLIFQEAKKSFGPGTILLNNI